jgi:hypothetical protein
MSSARRALGTNVTLLTTSRLARRTRFGRPSTRKSRRSVRCQSDGRFAFTTYSSGDGLPAAKYIVLFAELKTHRGNYLPPDKLNNLYNDPDKNRERPEFNIDLTTGPKTNQLFNLDVEGREPVTSPGPNTITQIGGGPAKAKASG